MANSNGTGGLSACAFSPSALPVFPLLIRYAISMRCMMANERHGDKFISARTWAGRWDCSLSSIRRAAKRFNIRTVYVGSGRNGLVRYLLSDIVKVERENGFEPADTRSRPELAPAAH